MRSLRERNRHNAMRETQRAALALFEERGFENVTVNEIADAVGMAPSTVFRHFATKEAIVLWDEFDEGLDELFAAELGARPPLEALRSVFVSGLGTRYDEDLDFQLRRVKFIYRTDALHSAAIEVSFADTGELADALAQVMSAQRQAVAPLLAGAAMVALDHAFDRWQELDGSVSLAILIEEAFDVVADLGAVR